MLFQPDIIEPELDDFETDTEARAAILSWIRGQRLGNCIAVSLLYVYNYYNVFTYSQTWTL